MAAGVHQRADLVRLLAAALAALTLAAFAAWLLAPAQPGPAPVDVDARAELGAAAVERAKDYRAPQRLLGLGATLAGLGLLGVLAAGRPARLAHRLGQLPGGPLLGGALAAAAMALGVALAELPFGLVAHGRAVDFGISTQGLGGWFADR
jgi:STE24 endopeptidase